jgi:N-methylhydantoinase A
MAGMPDTGTIAIDVGGTFTDITFADAGTGATWVAKTPSTPGDLSGGFIIAIRKVLAQAGRAAPDILRVFHGTTTATNAILEGKTPPTALITTAGFKYVLEIGRHDIPRHGNLYGWSKPARPITPDRVLEITDLLDAEGAILPPPDEDTARARAAAAQPACPRWPWSPARYANPSTSSGCRPSSPRSIPAHSCPCRRRCCRSSASSSAPWRPRSTPPSCRR